MIMHRLGAAGCFKVKYRQILHPLDVNNVIHVSVLIYCAFRNGEMVTEHPI